MPKFSPRFIFLLAFLSIIGLAANHYNLPLFFGVNFIFGSVAVLIAVHTLGTTAAVIIALITGAYTFWLWGHAYALIIFVVEALVVGVLYRRKIPSLILSDATFWIALGIPMIWLFYSGIMKLPDNSALLIMLKQPVNGISNAIIATCLLFLIPERYMQLQSENNVGKIQLKELIFTILLGLTFSAALILIIYQNNSERVTHEYYLEKELQQHLDYFDRKLNNSLGLQQIELLMEEYHLEKNDFDLAIFTKDNQLLTTSLSPDQANNLLTTGKNHQVKQGLSLWFPDRTNQPFIMWWRQALYYVTRDIQTTEPIKVYILQTSNTVINAMQEDVRKAFTLLFGIIFITGIISYLISSLLARTIVQLAQTTKDLPDKLHKGIQIDWPESNISELAQLSNQAEIMANNIARSFSDVNAQSHAIIESSSDSIITINQYGHIDSFNKSAENLFGYQRNELLGENVGILMPESSNGNNTNNSAKDLLQMAEKSKGLRYETLARHKNGSHFPVELSITKIQLQNRIIYAGIILDISERKASDKLKQEFISTVSHELRTPLTSIRGSIELMRGRKDVATVEENEKLMDVTQRNIDRLSDLIDDLLDIEKLSYGGISYNSEFLPIKNLLDDAIINNTPLSRQKNISLEINKPALGKIYADPVRIGQILTNFISNAVKFSAQGSKIILGSEINGSNVKIYVKDEGEGISEHFRDKIFERFSQADSSDTRKIQRGTGLGLAISKQLTEDMGGIIGFDSEEGKGSTFYIILPLIND